MLIQTPLNRKPEILSEKIHEKFIFTFSADLMLQHFFKPLQSIKVAVVLRESHVSDMSQQPGLRAFHIILYIIRDTPFSMVCYVSYICIGQMVT